MRNNTVWSYSVLCWGMINAPDIHWAKDCVCYESAWDDEALQNQLFFHFQGVKMCMGDEV